MRVSVAQPATGDKLTPLAGLANLQTLSLVGFGITNAAKLAGLDQLTDLNLANNAISKIDVLADQRLLDDGTPGTGDRPDARIGYAETGTWTTSSNTVAGTVHGDYRFAEGVGSTDGTKPTAKASWKFSDLVPGRYRVFTTWLATATRADDAPYTVARLVNAASGITKGEDALADGLKSKALRINQKLAPSLRYDTADTTGIRWESLGDFDVPLGDDGSQSGLVVTLANNASGIVAADGIRLLRVADVAGNPVSSPTRLDLRGNPLDDDARDMLVVSKSVAVDGADQFGRLAGTFSTTVLLSADNAAPGLANDLAPYTLVDQPKPTTSRSPSIAGSFGWADAFTQATGATVTGTDSRVLGLATDAAGNVYAVGQFTGTVNFDPSPTPAAAGKLVAAGTDGYLTKFESTGRFCWVVPFSTAGADVAYDVAVDSRGDVVVTGEFAGTLDVDPESDTTRTLTTNSVGGFVAKYDASGRLRWADGLTGTGNVGGRGIATEQGTGAIVVGGRFSGTADFDPGTGTKSLSTTGSTDYDGFVVKLNADGSLNWATNAGGSGLGDVVNDVAFDSQGRVVFGGSFGGQTLTAYSATSLSGSGPVGLTRPNPATGGAASDGFVGWLSTAGTVALLQTFGTNNTTQSEALLSLAVGSDDRVVTVGTFNLGTVLLNGTSTTSLVNAGTRDLTIISSYAPDGTLTWARQVGQVNSGLYGRATAVTSTGNVLVTGNYAGTNVDLDPGAGASLFSAQGSDDIFAIVLDSAGTFVDAKTYGSTDAVSEAGRAIAVDAYGNVILGGYFASVADFDPAGTTVTNLQAATGTTTGFITKPQLLSASPSAAGALQPTITAAADTDRVTVAVVPGSSVDKPQLVVTPTADFSGPVTVTVTSTDAAGRATQRKVEVLVPGKSGPQGVEAQVIDHRAFSNDGVAVVSPSITPAMPFASRALASAVQADGKTVSVGWKKQSSASDKQDFLLMRWNLDGTLDTSFGTGGFATLPSTFTIDQAAEWANVRVLADGRILVAGTHWLSSTSADNFIVARFTSTGQRDVDFNAGTAHDSGFSPRTRLRRHGLRGRHELQFALRRPADCGVGGEQDRRHDRLRFRLVRLRACAAVVCHGGFHGPEGRWLDRAGDRFRQAARCRQHTQELRWTGRFPPIRRTERHIHPSDVCVERQHAQHDRLRPDGRGRIHESDDIV